MQDITKTIIKIAAILGSFIAIFYEGDFLYYHGNSVLGIALLAVYLFMVIGYIGFYCKEDLIEVIVIGYVLIFGVGLILSNSPSNYTFVPNVVTGLSTLSGVLSAFGLYWLSQKFANKKTSRKDLSWYRIRLIVTLIFLGFIFLTISYSDLLFGNLNLSWREAFMGTDFIILALFDIIYISLFKEGFK